MKKFCERICREAAFERGFDCVVIRFVLFLHFLAPFSFFLVPRRSGLIRDRSSINYPHGNLRDLQFTDRAPHLEASFGWYEGVMQREDMGDGESEQGMVKAKIYVWKPTVTGNGNGNGVEMRGVGDLKGIWRVQWEDRKRDVRGPFPDVTRG